MYRYLEQSFKCNRPFLPCEDSGGKLRNKTLHAGLEHARLLATNKKSGIGTGPERQKVTADLTENQEGQK